MEISAENISLLDSVFKSDEQFWLLFLLGVASMIIAVLFAYKLHDSYDNEDIVDSLISENSKYCNSTREKYLTYYRIRMAGTAILFMVIAIILYTVSFSHI